jgi:alkylation response protein AidB-like acyl-CoA dehydrogenase
MAVPRPCALIACATILVAIATLQAQRAAVQIHGSNGLALEYPISRILCDARILSIFEGAAERSYSLADGLRASCEHRRGAPTCDLRT